MVSRRNFFMMASIMLIIFVLFQFSGIVKNNFDNFSVNSYAEAAAKKAEAKEQYDSQSSAADISGRKSAVYIGNSTNKGIGMAVKQWADYTKRSLKVCPSLSQWKKEGGSLPQMILLSPESVQWKSEVPQLEKLTEKGVALVLCELPDAQTIAGNPALQKLLGIQSIASQPVQVKGFHLFSGFLLGGESIYETNSGEKEYFSGISREIPWYILGAGTKTYLCGTLEKAKYPNLCNEDLPAVIWRSSTGNAPVFAVNGNYLKGSGGLGILNGFAYELQGYDLYPVANAQTLAVNAFPLLTQENDAVMQKLYSRSSVALQRDIMWNSLVSLAEQTNSKVTFLMAPQLNYSDSRTPDSSLLVYYLRSISEQQGEIGLSGGMNPNISLSAKLAQDAKFLGAEAPDYRFTALYTHKEEDLDANALKQPMLANLKTQITDFNAQDKIFSFQSGHDVLRMQTVSNCESQSAVEDLRLKSIETALGYSTAALDMEKVIYPVTAQESWENYSKKVFADYLTYWKPFRTFESTTVSESNQRIRNFLALDDTESRTGNTVVLNVKHLNGDAWFIFRTHNEEINTIKGATFSKLENNAYLLKIQSSTVQIQLKTKTE